MRARQSLRLALLLRLGGLQQPADVETVTEYQPLMGHRIATLVRLEQPAAAGGRLLITPAEALVQRIPPSTVWSQATLTIRRNDVLRHEELRRFVLSAGYVLDERVDEPGEIAIRGQVVDLFPADAPHPYRIRLAEEDRVAAIQPYDPANQRTQAEVDRLLVRPASEVVLPDELVRQFLDQNATSGDGEVAILDHHRMRRLLAGDTQGTPGAPLASILRACEQLASRRSWPSTPGEKRRSGFAAAPKTLQGR